MVPKRGVPLAHRLRGFGDRVALRDADRVVTYSALADRVEAARAELGEVRRLVLLALERDVESVVWHLAALAGGHPVLLADPARDDSELVATYDPDVVVRGGRAFERRSGTGHDLHGELALLMSTSGSTGSPRLVRLSAANVQANAEQIATYLDLQPRDVAVTTLPLHYCYGLSVLHSHLLRGAGVVLTSLSVVDRCFWELCRAHGVSSLSAVPHTVDLLERVGFGEGEGDGDGETELPTLRRLSVAGGKLAPARVRAWAGLGQRRGFDLVVMYGQTEATARMAYLPSELAATAPHTVGIAVPGGSLRLEPAGAEVGELVYSGPNVMLGYADTPADLARGRVVTELRTGDLARLSDGLVELVGRVSRFVKVFGLRIDLDRLERLLADAGLHALCAADGDVVVTAVAGGPDAVVAARDLLVARTGLPSSAFDLRVVDTLPRLPSGKPDHRAVLAIAPSAPTTGDAADTIDVVALIAELLDRPDAGPDDTFVSLGGDSLSYVEVSLRLEQLLGHLPHDWHTTSLGDLQRGGARRARRGTSLETSVLLRALAIVAVVGTHGNLFVLTGGAHVLLGLIGFNLARFQLATPDRRERVRRVLTGVARVAVPSVLWLGGVTVVASAYPWPTVLLVNGLLGPQEWAEPAWHLWFLEALVALLLATAALLAVPVVHRLDRRLPFWFPLGLAALALLTRYDVVSLRGGDEIHRAHVVAWLFFAGWAAARARTTTQRAAVSLLLAVAVPGFLDDPARESVVLVGMLLLVWVPRVRVPRAASRVLGLLAAASLYVYLVHWQVYPRFEDDRPLLGVVLSLAAGVGAWAAAERVPGVVHRVVAAARGAQRRAGSAAATTVDPESSSGTEAGSRPTDTRVPTG